MKLKQFKKKAFTLIELIIVIVLIGILAGMSLPKFIGVQRNAKVASMVRDIDTLEKAIKLYENDNDTLPIYDVGIDGSNLGDPTKDMEDIYISLKEVLKVSEDGEEYLYKINMGESSKYHSKTKYGHGKTEKDFYVYSTKTDRVYYYGYLVNDKKEYQHNEVPVALSNNIVNNKVTKLKSKPLSNKVGGGLIDDGTVPEVIQNPIWSNNLNEPKVHDKDFDSLVKSPSITITWTGDLTNRKINFKLIGFNLYVKDKDGNNISFIDSTGRKVSKIYSYTTLISSFIMPEGAASIYIDTHLENEVYLYELSETDNLKLPSKVNNVKYTPNQTTIDLSWDKPTDSDYSKTLIYKNGEYDGETTSTSFTSKGLQEDKEYTYILYHQNTSGNISNKTIVKAKTITDGITWSNNLNDPKLHDKDFDSLVKSPSVTITWTGDLTNRKINFKLNYFYLYVKDKDGNNISFIDSTGRKVSEISSSGAVTSNFIMPEGAVSIYITARSEKEVYLYELSETDNLKLPSQVDNVKYTPDETSINFSWDKPTDSDYSKTLIYKNGEYDGETTSTSFTSKGLQEDKEYTYTLYHQNTSGNISNKTVVKAKTITDGIIWSNNLNEPKLHDKDINSLAQSPSVTITWTGDLTNKKINFKLRYFYLYVKDKDGNNISFINSTGTKVSEISSSGVVTSNFIMPEGAASIYITARSENRIYLYDLSD